MPAHRIVDHRRGRRARDLLLGAAVVVLRVVAAVVAPGVRGGRGGCGVGVQALERETALDLLLHELGAVLESLITVLFKDGSVMLMRNLTAVEDHADEVLELAPGVAGVVDVGGRL